MSDRVLSFNAARRAAMVRANAGKFEALSGQGEEFDGKPFPFAPERSAPYERAERTGKPGRNVRVAGGDPPAVAGRRSRHSDEARLQWLGRADSLPSVSVRRHPMRKTTRETVA
jgi:hypothetical protein